MTQIYVIVVSKSIQGFRSLNLTQVMFILPLVLYLHSVIRESPWRQKNMSVNTQILKANYKKTFSYQLCSLLGACQTEKAIETHLSINC